MKTTILILTIFSVLSIGLADLKSSNEKQCATKLWNSLRGHIKTLPDLSKFEEVFNKNFEERLRNETYEYIDVAYRKHFSMAELAELTASSTNCYQEASQSIINITIVLSDAIQQCINDQLDAPKSFWDVFTDVITNAQKESDTLSILNTWCKSDNIEQQTTCFEKNLSLFEDKFSKIDETAKMNQVNYPEGISNKLLQLASRCVRAQIVNFWEDYQYDVVTNAKQCVKAKNSQTKSQAQNKFG